MEDAEVRREEDIHEPIAFLSILTSSRMTSHLPVRISEANLPQCAKLLMSLSEDKTQKWYR